MLIHVEGLKIPNDLLVHVKYGETDRSVPRLLRKPASLVPLEDAPWPGGVKDKTSQVFKNIGIENPLKQKLVEPKAHVFGGWDREMKKYNLSGVN